MESKKFGELPNQIHAHLAWKSIDFISDIHLHAQDPVTAAAWQRYLLNTPADAVIILGDLFELWIGDDLINASPAESFESMCVQVLRKAAKRRCLWIMCGNRDFLMGPSFMLAAGAQAIPDPCVLIFQGQRYLLSHGDALCVSDTSYMALRQQLRSPQWQQEFLAHGWDHRMAIGRALRAQSQAAQKQLRAANQWFDVDPCTARNWLTQNQCSILIHGHTHQPAVHDLGSGLYRWVLSDWDAGVTPARLQVLRLANQGLKRLELSDALK